MFSFLVYIRTMVHKWFPVCASLCMIFVCTTWTVKGQPQLDTSSNPNPNCTEDSIVIQCSAKRRSRFIVKTAEFLQANKQYCTAETCQSIYNISGECRLRPSKVRGRKICKQKFRGKDVWLLYQQCGSKVNQGLPCRQGDMAGVPLSQKGGYEVNYDCLNDTLAMDPCGALNSTETQLIYHDLSSSDNQRQCTCTGSVLGLGEARDDSMDIRMKYLVMLDPSILASRQDIVKTTVTSENEEQRMNASPFPEITFVNVTSRSPSIMVTLRVHESGNLSGFVWIRFTDVKVSLTCTTSWDFSETSGEETTSFESVFSVRHSMNNEGTDQLIITAAAASSAVAMVIITLLVLCALLRRRRRQRQRIPPPGDESSPSAHRDNYAYAEVTPRDPQNTPQHSQNSPPVPEYMEPSQLHARPPGNDVSDYALLQHHVSERAPPASGSDDIYDHAMRSREEYQALNREPSRQEVIDNDYDSTERYS